MVPLQCRFWSGRRRRCRGHERALHGKYRQESARRLELQTGRRNHYRPVIAADIHAALQKMPGIFGNPYLKEFRAGTGLGAGSERYLDAWTIQPYPSLPLVRTAIEIKVTRGDFTKEKRRPMKRDAAMRIANEFYFAAPKGLLTESDL